MPGASRSIVIKAPLEKVFQTVSDYDRYASFLPEVKSVRTSERNGAQVLVHYELQLIKTVRYTLRMHEEPPTRIRWTFAGGDFMKDNQGSWTFRALGPSETEATYQIEVKVGLLVPGSVVNALVDSSLPKMLEAFKRRAESA
jgi:coenzyme Q-binding protein COQ10